MRILRPISGLSFVGFLAALVVIDGCGGGSNTGGSGCLSGDCAPPGSSGGDHQNMAGSNSGSGGDGPIGECAPGADEGTAPPPDQVADVEPDPNVTQTLYIDHLGYAVEGTKRAVIEASGELTSFRIVEDDTDSSVRFVGELEETEAFTAWGGSSRYYVADFTTLREPGTYRLSVNGTESPPFRIEPRLHFEATFEDVLGYFRSSRADDSAVWSADAAIPKYPTTSPTYDVRGGWYDASGDISKYLSHLSYANFMNPQQIPLTAWALAWVHDEAGSLLSTKGLTAEVQAEALWGADYLVRVLDDAGYFYINVFDGWSAALGERHICAFHRVVTGMGEDNGQKNSNYQAAFREGGGMSIAALARVARWGVPGAFTSAEYLSAAQKGFEHLQANNTSYCDDGVENIIDDYTALLAASELFDTTSDATYLTAARSRAEALIDRLHPEGYFIADSGARPFWHASDAGLPVVALVRYAEVETDTARQDSALDAVATHLEYLLSVTSEVSNPFGYARQHINVGNTAKSSFFIPQDNETNYWYQGESARLASLSAAARIGGRALAAHQGCPEKPSRELAAFATDQIDWILGKNPYDVSFLAGTGRNNPPTYCVPTEYHGHLAGGISNGITSANADGSGIQWLPSVDECWEHWRWVEQWLPHSTWYMLAITAAAL